LKGSGTQGRFIRLDDAAVLDTPAVEAFLRAAVQQAKSPLPKTGRGLHGDQSRSRQAAATASGR